MIKRTLEQRIARLEKLFNSKVKKSHKFEGLHPDMLQELQVVFDNNFGAPGYYGSEREFQLEMEGMADGANDMMVSDAIQYLCDEFGYDEDRLESIRSDIADDLSQMAQSLLNSMNDEDDDWDEDDIDECRGRNCESRKVTARKAESRKSAIQTRKVESNKLLKHTKNEAVKQLPNGMTANNVADVLSGFAGTSWSNPRAAIAKLDRMGILDASTNKWYPTVDDVADAIEDCWDDSIGNGRGAAEFFIGNFGGATRCSLTLYPISGGTSRARNLTLKFNWPEEDIM